MRECIAVEKKVIYVFTHFGTGVGKSIQVKEASVTSDKRKRAAGNGPVNIVEIRLCIEVIRALLYDGELSYKKLGDLLAQKERLDEDNPHIFDLMEVMSEAKKRGRTQLSECVNKVEKEFGFKFVDGSRSGRSICPTDDAAIHLQSLEHLVDVYNGVRGLGTETVRISAIDAANNYWIPDALKTSLRSKWSDVNLHCQTREWWRVLDDVRKGLSDFGIAIDVPDDSLVKTPLLTRPHVAVFSDQLGQLKKMRRIGLQEFAEHGAICLHFFSAPVALEAQIRGEKTRIIRVNSNAQAAAWAARGLGIALLVADAIPREYPLVTKPLAFETIDGSDCLYSRKEGMSQTAKQIHDTIAKWGEKKTQSAAKRSRKANARRTTKS